MAKKNETETVTTAVPRVRVKNLSPVSRDYPLTGGESLYLRPAGRGNKGIVIDAAKVSAAMKAAEQAGAISIENEGGAE